MGPDQLLNSGDSGRQTNGQPNDNIGRPSGNNGQPTGNSGAPADNNGQASGNEGQPTRTRGASPETNGQPSGNEGQANGNSRQATGNNGLPGGRNSTNGNNFQVRRKKRFVDQLRNINKTRYDENFNNGNELRRNDLQTPRDEMSDLEELFKHLYMEIPRWERIEAGHNISDMLVRCSFAGHKCYSDKFRVYQTADYGNCWTLSWDKLTVTRSGPEGGLEMILFLENGEFLKGVTDGSGIRIAFHGRDTLPYPVESGQYLPSSFETNIGLRLVNISRKGQPYGDCDDGVAFRNKYNVKYSRQVCLSLCFVNKLLAECGCYDIFQEELFIRMHARKENKLCKTIKGERQCVSQISNLVEQKSLQCTCDNPCIETQYVKVMSSRQWPDDQYANVLLRGACEVNSAQCEDLRVVADKRSLAQHFLKVNIYYEDLNFEIIEETPEIEDAQFLSDVGGAIGLWIGLSILSMCELIQLLAEIVAYCHHLYNRNSRSNVRRNKRRNYRGRECNVTANGENGYGFVNRDERKQWQNIYLRDFSRYKRHEHTAYTSNIGS